MTLPATAISVRQPWAWAIIYGGKDVENRTKAPFGTKGLIGRRIAIHAAQGMTQHEYESARMFMLNLGITCPRPDKLIRGAILGSVRLDDVVSARPSRWFSGPRGLVLYDAKACDPVPASGQLGWFKWKPEDRDPIAALPWMRKWPNTIVHREFCNVSPGPLFEGADK